MTSVGSIQWLIHFVPFVKPSKENKIVLLVDGHVSHKSLQVVEFAIEHGIEMICFPAHCTLRMQPLDVTFFGALKSFYDQECALWTKSHPGRTITLTKMPELFSAAYKKAATVKNACSGFAKTGIYLLHPSIFPDKLFAPAETTNRSLVETNESSRSVIHSSIMNNPSVPIIDTGRDIPTEI